MLIAYRCIWSCSLGRTHGRAIFFIAPALPFLASSITAGAAAARGLIATRIESLGRGGALVRIDVQRVFRPTPALLLRIAGADEDASARQLKIPCEGVDDPQGFVEQVQTCLHLLSTRF